MKYFKLWALLLCFACGVGSVRAESYPIADPSTAGYTIVVATSGEVTATFLGSTAWYANSLYLGDQLIFSKDLYAKDGSQVATSFNQPVGTTVSLGYFEAGTVLTFSLVSTDYGGYTNTWYTGDPSLNKDGQAHATVESWTDGSTLVSFEDLYNGPFNFNDTSFSFTNTMAAPVPEASTLALMVIGSLGLSYRLRRIRAAGARGKSTYVPAVMAA